MAHLVKFPSSGHSPSHTADLMRDAYKDIPADTVHKLWQLYSTDYTLFSYPYPEGLGAR